MAPRHGPQAGHLHLHLTPAPRGLLQERPRDADEHVRVVGVAAAIGAEARVSAVGGEVVEPERRREGKGIRTQATQCKGVSCSLWV